MVKIAGSPWCFSEGHFSFEAHGPYRTRMSQSKRGATQISVSYGNLSIRCFMQWTRPTTHEVHSFCFQLNVTQSWDFPRAENGRGFSESDEYRINHGSHFLTFSSAAPNRVGRFRFVPDAQSPTTLRVVAILRCLKTCTPGRQAE